MKSVLLVDDDEHFQYSLRRSCKKIPEIIDFFTANNGQEAVDFLVKRIEDGERPPDFILLDINMPVMDGFEFLARYGALKSQYGEALNTIVLAMLTSSAHAKDRDRAMATGLVQSYVIKPVDAAEAVSMIQRLVA